MQKDKKYAHITAAGTDDDHLMFCDDGGNTYLSVYKDSDEDGQKHFIIKAHDSQFALDGLRDMLDSASVDYEATNQTNHLKITGGERYLVDALTSAVVLNDGEKIFSLRTNGREEDAPKPESAFIDFISGNGGAQEVANAQRMVGMEQPLLSVAAQSRDGNSLTIGRAPSN